MTPETQNISAHGLPFKKGDIIVGHYNSSGALVDAPTIVGTKEQIDDMQNRLKGLASRVAGAIIPDAPKESKKKKVSKKKTEPVDFVPLSELQPVTTQNQSRVPEVSVTFNSEFGSAELKAKEVVAANHGVIVFFDRNSKISFTPKIGQLVYVEYNDETYATMYTGIKVTRETENEVVMVFLDYKEEIA